MLDILWTNEYDVPELYRVDDEESARYLARTFAIQTSKVTYVFKANERDQNNLGSMIRIAAFDSMGRAL